MKCWNCGLGMMSPWEELGKGWFKCSNCGATWTEVPIPRQAIAEEIITHGDGSKRRHFKAKLVRSKAKK